MTFIIMPEKPNAEIIKNLLRLLVSLVANAITKKIIPTKIPTKLQIAPTRDKKSIINI